MRVTVIVLAAGYGRRLKSPVSKALVKIGSKPLLVYSLEAFSRHPLVKEIIVAANPDNRQAILKEIRHFGISKVRCVILGGRERQDSVKNALGCLDSAAEIVLVHDGARPFIDRLNISQVIKAAKETGAAILAVPVKATLKKVSSKLTVKETLDRSVIWEVQTPQGFRKGIIDQAFRRFGNLAVTDDAMLAEKLGKEVKVVRGSYLNIKVTTPEDLFIAGAIAKQLKK